MSDAAVHPMRGTANAPAIGPRLVGVEGELLSVSCHSWVVCRRADAAAAMGAGWASRLLSPPSVGR